MPVNEESFDDSTTTSDLRRNVCENLRYLFHTGDSIAQIAKDLDLNRQQVNKYLSGVVSPSYVILWRLVKYFGISMDDMFVDPAEFPARFQRIAKTERRHNAPDFGFEDWIKYGGQWNPEAGEYDGKYWLYVVMPNQSRRVMKAFVRLQLRDERMVVDMQEVFMNDAFYLQSRLVRRQVGMANIMSDRLFMVTFNRNRTSDFPNDYLECYVFYPRPSRTTRFLKGRLMSVTNHGFREIYAVDAALEYIGNTPVARDDLRPCGVFAHDHGNIPAAIRKMLFTA